MLSEEAEKGWSLEMFYSKAITHFSKIFFPFKDCI